MRHLLFTLIPITVYLTFLSCGTSAPAEETVREKIMGKFCAEGYTLEMNDSTYRNTKSHTGLTTGNPFSEYCKGKYELVFEGNQWIIKFFKDTSPSRTTIYDCEKEVTVWEAGKGYLMGEDQITMEDLFDGKKLVKNACSE